MSDKKEQSKLVKIDVTKLTLGMFVTAIEQSGVGKVAIANTGQIKDLNIIKKLTTSGVKFVWIDPARSATTDKKDKNQSNQESAKPEPKSKSSAQSIKQAKNILGEAKNLVKKVLDETFEGKAIAVEPFEALADNMIESALDDDDALKCVSALRKKDAYLLEHSINVAFLLVTFGKYLKLDKAILKQLAVGGMLHDIGKVKINNEVLHKPGKLTEQEFEHIKLHQVFAKEIIDETEGLSQISKDVCLMHHEKLDGKGYPAGLTAEQLPKHARMSCIVDIYDALTATRCYKEAMSPAKAFKILLSLAPHHLDQTLVYEFIRCVGVYPVGSLVQLSDGRVGIIWKSKGRDALNPVLKCFYSVTHKRYTEVTMVDLLKSDLHIERGISPSTLDVDPTPFYA